MRAVIDGRVVLDVMQSIQTDHKLSSYTLNYVSERFLGERKEDVHHSMIAKLHRGDRNTRQRLAAYCLKDAQLPVTALFPAPVQLEFEKVYHPYLLMGKKRYAGLLWTRADRHDKLDTKGIETVRRDNCAFARNTIAGVLRRVLVLRDVPGSVVYVKGRIEELLTGRVDISELVITKGLTREVSEYATRAAHVELAAKRRRRHAATAPRVGDRVPWIGLNFHQVIGVAIRTKFLGYSVFRLVDFGG
ncbi:DNA polymerase delta catalytic subunit [Cymbomonas tetramitiformis]|uniref:DNA-directed DNA polymerase n=1 Tax=Cymbomonas tetramitiformis TaxID=36881 RepID=A0AAE0GU57_9CHLO|nr:DNA polymerase delta catalytic subunit [Cymbomonas tetramitiformis]